MSNLNNFTGNIIQTFGEYFPVPLIEEITISSEGATVLISLHFESPTTIEDPSTEFPAGMQALMDQGTVRIWIGQLWSKSTIEEVINQKVNILKALGQANLFYIPDESLLEDSSSDPEAGFGLAFDSDAWPEGAGYAVAYGQRKAICLSLENFYYAAEIETPGEKRIYKYVATGKLNPPNNVEFGTLAADEYYSDPAEVPAMGSFAFQNQIQSWEDVYSKIHPEYRNLTVFAFGAVWNYYDTTDWDELPWYNPDYTEGAKAAAAISTGNEEILNYTIPPTITTIPPVSPVLLEKGVGHISYEPVFVDGEVVAKKETVFVDSEDVVYSLTPLRAIDGIYHQTTTITNLQIQDNIEKLLADFEPSYNVDSQLTNMVDAINVTINIHSESSEFLRELYRLREVFPDQSLATKTGELYSRFSDRIFRADRILRRAPALKKKLVFNPKIKDIRYQDVGSMYTTSNMGYHNSMQPFEWWNPLEYINLNEMRMNRVAYMMYPGSTTEALVRYNGYFFVDIEKILRTQSVMSLVLDVNIVEQYFGKELTNACIVPAQLNLMRYDNGEQIVQLQCVFDKHKAYPKVKYTNYVPTPDIDESLTTRYGLNTSMMGRQGWEAKIESHVVPRSLNVASAGGIGDYRLMGFEFYDERTAEVTADGVVGIDLDGGSATGYSGEYYGADFTFEDYSCHAINAIVSKFESMMETWTTYYDLATEECSYNYQTEVMDFNQFFIDGIMAAYADDPNGAPWVYCPAIYAMFADLMYGAHDHSTENTRIWIEETANMLSPLNTTLTEMQYFGEMIQTFYDEYITNQLLLQIEAQGLGGCPNTVTISALQDNYSVIPPLYVQSDVEISQAEIAVEELTWIGGNVDYPIIMPWEKWFVAGGETSITAETSYELRFTRTNLVGADGSVTATPSQDIGGEDSGNTTQLNYLEAPVCFVLEAPDWNATSEGSSAAFIREVLDSGISKGGEMYPTPAQFKELIQDLVGVIQVSFTDETGDDDPDQINGLNERTLSPYCLSRTWYDERTWYNNGYYEIVNGVVNNTGDASSARSAQELLARLLWPNKALIVKTFGLEELYDTATPLGTERVGSEKSAWLVTEWVRDLCGLSNNEMSLADSKCWPAAGGADSEYISEEEDRGYV